MSILFSDKQLKFISDWLAELRSGKLSQTTGVLFRSEPYDYRYAKGQDPLPAGYCCIGVASSLCPTGPDVAVEGFSLQIDDDSINWNCFDHDDREFVEYDSEEMPSDVFTALTGLPASFQNFLVAANDDSLKSFEEIADMIEAKRDELMANV